MWSCITRTTKYWTILRRELNYWIYDLYRIWIDPRKQKYFSICLKWLIWIYLSMFWLWNNVIFILSEIHCYLFVFLTVFIVIGHLRKQGEDYSRVSSLFWVSCFLWNWNNDYFSNSLSDLDVRFVRSILNAILRVFS